MTLYNSTLLGQEHMTHHNRTLLEQEHMTIYNSSFLEHFWKRYMRLLQLYNTVQCTCIPVLKQEYQTI